MHFTDTVTRCTHTVISPREKISKNRLNVLHIVTEVIRREIYKLFSSSPNIPSKVSRR